MAALVGPPLPLSSPPPPGWGWGFGSCQWPVPDKGATVEQHELSFCAQHTNSHVGREGHEPNRPLDCLNAKEVTFQCTQRPRGNMPQPLSDWLSHGTICYLLQSALPSASGTHAAINIVIHPWLCYSPEPNIAAITRVGKYCVCGLSRSIPQQSWSILCLYAVADVTLVVHLFYPSPYVTARRR